MAVDPARYCRRYEGVSRGGSPWAVDVLQERFLGPEIFFNPQLCSRGSGERLWMQRGGPGAYGSGKQQQAHPPGHACTGPRCSPHA